MTREYVWRGAYIAAMLELDPGQLQSRISEARELIARRLEEINNDSAESEEERSALTDAQQNLRALMRTVEQKDPRGRK